MKNSILACALGLLVVAGVSCKKKNNVSCNGTTPTYTSYVQSLVNTSCVGCHANYGTYSGLKTIVDNGSFESQVITTQKMPQGGSLSSDQLSTLKCWIENGAPN